MTLIGVQKCAILFYLIVYVFDGLDGKQFPCENNRLIDNPRWFCDLSNDCSDGSDERYGCNYARCGFGNFTCSNLLQCLPISVRCDGKLDCDDGSDERYCNYFQCKNGQLIHDHWFCDKENDCFDGSDESDGCSKTCGRKKFTCTSGQCFPISVRCDGKENCGDKSDEMNCEHALSLKNCTQEEGKYLCKDGLQCIPLDRVCYEDKRFHCKDFSDGHENCYEVKDCDPSEDECDQLCVKYRGMIQCSCNEGYGQPNVSNGICVNEVPQENILLYSNRQGVFGYSLTTRQQIFVENKINITFITAAHNYVYWSETLNKTSKIFRKIPQKTTEELIYPRDSNDTSSITSIAVDWIGNNTYFTSQNSLSVCNNNGSNCRKLKNSTFSIESVALLPRKGLMFWIQNSEDKYNNASIFVSSMDGSHEHVLIDNVHLLNHLAVDESSEKIYWLDIGTSTIESMKYNGKRRKIEIPGVQNVFSFSVFEGKLYLTLRNNSGIFQGRNLSVWLRGVNAINEIHIYNPRLQNTKISNPCTSVSCNGLCLLRPASPSPGLNSTCLRSLNTDTTTSPNPEASTRNSPENTNGQFRTSTEEIITNSDSTASPNLETSSARNSPKNTIEAFQTSTGKIIPPDDPKYAYPIFESIEIIIIILIALGGMVCAIIILYLCKNKRRSNNQSIHETKDGIEL